MESYALCSRDAGRNLSFALLADLPESLNLETGAKARIPLLVSHYGGEIPKASA